MPKDNKLIKINVHFFSRLYLTQIRALKQCTVMMMFITGYRQIIKQG